jgi:Domain of unknown function (DUF4349)
MRSGRGAVTLLAALAAGAALLAGCGGGADTQSSSREGGGAAAPAAAPPDSAAKAASGSAGFGANDADQGKGTLARVAPQLQQLIRRADVTVEAKDVTAAADNAKQLVTAAKGVVYSEESNTDPNDLGSARIQLTFKVPPGAFDGVVRALGQLGDQRSSTTSTEDVTDQVVDVEARIRSQQESVNRVRALLGQAKTVGEVVQVESELTRRVSDLEALQSRQKALADQVAMSTVTLHLFTRSPASADLDPAGGFVAGLESGWHAFTTSVNVALLVLGALLPFLVVVALLWLPARWAIRQLRRRMPPAPGGAPVPAFAAPVPPAAPPAAPPAGGRPSGG